MTNVGNILQQTIFTTGASAATGAGVAWWKGFEMKEAVIISTVTGLATSATTAILDRDAHIVLKALFVAGTVIGTLMALQSGSNYLQSKFGLVIDPKLVSYLTVANIAGQFVTFLYSGSSPELTLDALDKMNEDQVKALHAKMTPEAFDQLGVLLQARLAKRFEGIEGLEPIKAAPELNVEAIGKFTEAEARYLYSYSLDQGDGKPALTWTSIITGKDEQQAVIKRFFDFKLIDTSNPPKALLDSYIKEHPLPTTAEELDSDKLSMADARFYITAYKCRPDLWAALSIAAQWALVKGKPEELAPTYDAARLKDAPKEFVEHLLKGDWLSFPTDIQAALQEKCKEFSITNEGKLHPQDGSEVTALSTEELKAYLARFKNADFVAKLPEAAVPAMLAAFCAQELDPAEIPVAVFTPARTKDLPFPTTGIPGAQKENLKDSALPWLHKAFQGDLVRWYDLTTTDRAEILTARFEELKLRPFFVITKPAELPTMDKATLEAHEAAFKGSKETWDRFYKHQKTEFVSQFESNGITPPYTVGWWG